MRLIYVDIDVSWTGLTHIGTPADPWSLDQLIAQQQNDDYYKIKGSRVVTSTIGSIYRTGVICDSWDLDLYGPWRFDFKTATIQFSNGSLLRNGYLRAGDGSGLIYLDMDAENMFLEEYSTAIVGSISSIKGSLTNCTLVVAAKTVYQHNVNSWTNCVIKQTNVGNINIIGTCTINCDTNAADQATLFSVIGTLTDAGIGYNKTLAATPSFSETDLTKFDLYANASIGTLGYWANTNVIYYVDISTTNDVNTSYSGLLEALPMTWANFNSSIQNSSWKNSYIIKGQRDVGSVWRPYETLVHIPPKHSFQAWTLGIFGPWRIRATDIRFTTAGISDISEATPNITNGILSQSSSTAELHLGMDYISSTLRDVFIGGKKLVIYGGKAGTTIDIQGCTINITELAIDPITTSNITINFKDCVIIGQILTSAATIAWNFEYCEFIQVSPITFENGQPGSFTYSGVTWGLSSSTFPAWNAPEESWRYNTFNITQEGSGNYVNYPTGLFGNSRTGLGAFSFYVLTPPASDDIGVFARKEVGSNATLTVVSNVVSRMGVAENADQVINNLRIDEDIIVGPRYSDIEDINFNLDITAGGVQALRRVTSIKQTDQYDPNIPMLLNEDMYKNKRSQLAEGSDDSADSGAIEYYYLNDRRAYTDPSDDNIAVITPQARNLMARASLGFASTKITGFVIGRGGYEYHNPVKILPIHTISDVAKGWFEVLSNQNWSISDTIKLQGYGEVYEVRPKLSVYAVDSDSIYYFEVGSDIYDTVQNIADKINGITFLYDTVYASIENTKVILNAVPAGSIGNTIWYETSSVNITSPAQSGGHTFIGGVDESIDGSMIDPITLPNGGEFIVEPANQNSIAITIKLAPDLTIANYAIGEIAIKAQITNSRFPGEVGTEYLMALGHIPMCVKNNKMVWVRRFIVQL